MTRDIAAAESAEMAEEQDKKSREVNLIIVSIPYHQNEHTWKAVFDNVLKKMQLSPTPKFHAFRLGHGSCERPAPMMVQFRDSPHRTALESRNLVMQKKLKMKGTPVLIFPDLTPKQRQALPLEREKVKQAREQGLWSELREGIASRPVPMRKQAHASVSDPKATQVEGIKVAAKDLPDDLVETIIAMLPFPAIFKARCLSKSWLVRFSSIADLDDEENKGLAISFQKLVGQYSHNWKTFLPVACRVDSIGRSPVAYDRSFLKWQRLPFLSFLPDFVNPNWDSLRIDGALWHWWAHHRLVVINVFTQRCKLLPPFPGGVASRYDKYHIDKNHIKCRWEKVVSQTVSDYKVILFCRNENRYTQPGYFLHIYNSSSDSWTTGTEKIENCWINTFTSIAYLNGLLYILYCYGSEGQDLLALNLENGTRKTIRLSIKMDFSTNLVVCNGNLLIVATGVCDRVRLEHVPRLGAYIPDHLVGHLRTEDIMSEGPYYYNLVFAIDVGSGLALEVARSKGVTQWDVAASDGKSIFLANSRDSRDVLEYDSEEKKWISVRLRDPIPDSSRLRCFRPGLNTFAAV